MLAPMTAPSLPPGPVTGPAVWYGRDLAAREREWIYRLSPAELAEIDAAVHIFKASGRPLAAITPEDFPLPAFGAALRGLGAELLDGRGFFMLRGFRVDDYRREEQAIAYMGIGSYFGRPRSQNAKGHLLGHVKDLGLDIADPNVRYYQTSRRLEYHTDSVDVVGLLCLKTARAGGESFVVSSCTIYNEILTRRPDLLPALFEPFATDRRGEIPAGMKPWFDIPVFHWYADRLTCIYVRQYIESAQRNFRDVRRLTEAQIAAMDLMDEIANDPDVHLAMAFAPGDMQFLHNHQILHSRNDFVNWPELERHRHLLRLWVAPPGARLLPEVFAPRYGGVVPGERGGIVVPGTTLRVPLEAE